MITFSTMAKTIVCVADEGEVGKDAAFLLKNEEFKAIFLQGSKAELIDNPRVFEGIPLSNVKFASSHNGRNIVFSGVLMGQVKQKLQLKQVSKTQYKGVNKMGDDFKVRLTCQQNENIRIEPLR